MSWPKKLLPTIFYRYINIDFLFNKNVVLIRQTPDKEIFEPDGEKIKLKYVCEPIKNMDDLSFNLYGEVNEDSIVLDIKKDFKKFYYDIWKVFQKSRRPTADHFERNNKKGWFYAPVKKLHNIDLPNNDDREAFSFKLSCRVIHLPTRCNFWHAQLEWRDANGKVITRSDKEWIRTVQTATRVMVRSAAIATLNDVPHKIPFHTYFILSFDWFQKKLA